MKLAIALAFILLSSTETHAQAPCLNDQKYAYDGMTCKKIRFKESRRQEFCKIAEVSENCPQTCGKCCDDDPNFSFPLILEKTQFRGCDWISKNKKKISIRRGNYCEPSDTYSDTSIRNMCPKACKFCKNSIDVTDCSATGNPVCTEDGITIQNACVAKYQGVSNYTEGSCPGTGGFAFDNSSPIPIKDDVINLFKEENFKFLGRVNLTFGGEEEEFVEEPNVEDDLGEGYYSDEDDPRKLLRFTNAKFAYGTNNFEPIKDDTPSPSSFEPIKDDTPSPSSAAPTAPPAPYMNRSRDLVIIGDDTRTEVADTKVKPYQMIVKLNGIGCTGSVVARNKVLTAAHCVFSRTTNTTGFPPSVTPGLDATKKKDGIDVVKPFGSWNVTRVCFQRRYQSAVGYEQYTYDIAVLTLDTNEEGRHIGDTVGTFDLVVPDKKASINPQSSVSGYPGDKYIFYPSRVRWTSWGAPMWTSGMCSSWTLSSNFKTSKIVKNTCDTKGGMSGGPYYTPDNKQFGVHTHGFGSVNAGTGITEGVKNYATYW